MRVLTCRADLEQSATSIQARYSLHAVCVHEGTATLGHFWTYVYHTDRQKWFRYNDNEGMETELLDILHVSRSFVVVESKWADVVEAGIGGHRTNNERDDTRVPSAYLLVYINAEQRSLSNGS